MKAGNTFFFAAEKSHLWVIITTPSGSDGDFLAVNMTSARNTGARDSSCILIKGDHPFVSRNTEMCYQRALEMSLHGPTGIITNRAYIIPSKSVSPGVLKKIQKGALASRFLKLRYKETVQKELQNAPRPPGGG
ncbi:MAG: hypothetical protein KKH28_02405 [Elusimicrobia bacterium]|nr:hypothetical protein [Elusimicrobiota bacterium]